MFPARATRFSRPRLRPTAPKASATSRRITRRRCELLVNSYSTLARQADNGALLSLDESEGRYSDSAQQRPSLISGLISGP
jgi:hypothetical protein